MSRLQDRVVVVTGGGSGIGLAVGPPAGRRGRPGRGRRPRPDHRRRRRPRSAGCSSPSTSRTRPRSTPCSMPRSTPTARSDVAFNNAGISPPEDDSLLDTDLDVWRRVQEVNLTSVFLCCKHAIPHMRRAGKGSIINTASFVAVMGAATSQVSYTASKGGVLAMTRELGVQFAREGIRVNALCPGPVNTPLLHRAVRQGPRARRPPPGARADGPLRRAGRDRRRRWRSWPATTPRSSPPRPSWSTAASPAPT